MKKILLTGPNGFIGRHAIDFLLSRGFEVHAVDLNLPDKKSENINWHKADLLDINQTNKLVASIKPTYLLHFAWYAVPKKYWTSPENIRWVQASLELLRAFTKHGGKRVVMAGTCAEYDWDYGYCSEEITPLKPATLYGTCKHSLQMMLHAYAKQMGVSAAWGRIFFLYGPHEHPSRLISSVILSLLRKEDALCSHGKQIRDFLYVEDVASAFVALLESDVQGPVNIASGKPISLEDAIRIIAKELDGDKLIKFGALKAPNEPPLIVGDVGCLANAVGWSPVCSLKDGLLKSIEWWKMQLGK